MTPDVWREVSECLDRLMDLDPPAAEDYLRRLRAERPELADEVESLWRQEAIGTQFDVPPTLPVADAPPGDPPSATETAGGYELLGEIARGGMGAVFEARDPTFDRTLAIKVLLPELRHHPEARHRFLREARITGRLQHPGIPPIHELGQLADGSPFFAMKLIRGRTLAAILKERKPDPTEAVATFEHICRTLAYAHSQHTIHRDLKPGNVMVGAYGEVQVMDWGLAKVLGDPEVADPTIDSTADPTATRSGDVRGTLSYMAPEQARGDTADQDERCDVFGLGGILVAVLTRQPTYTGPVDDMLRQARAGEVGPAIQRVEAERVDADLLDIVRRCLAPRKEDRFRHAGEVADAVTAHRESARRLLEQANLERKTAEVKAAEERRRRRVVIGFGTALLAAVVVGLGLVSWFWWQADERRQAAEDAERRVTDEQTRTEETARQARKAIQESFILATEDPEFQKQGMQEVRRLLLDRALAFYREFTRLRENDLALREEVADAHDRIGQVLSIRGEHQTALAEYERAIELTESLAAGQPDAPRFPIQLTTLFRHKAAAEQALGRADPAAESLRQARRHLTPALTAEPNNPEWIYLDAVIHSALAQWHYAQGRLDDAATEYQQSLDKATYLNETLQFKKVKVVTTAVAALVGLGHVRKDQRNPAAALDWYRRAVRPLDDMHKAYPGVYSRAELARLYGSMAIVQDDLGQVKAAVESHRKAIGYREQLVQANPLVPEYRNDLAISHVNLAMTVRNGNPADPEVRRALGTAVEITGELVQQHPDAVAYLRQAAFTRIALAHTVRQNPKEIAQAEGLLADARKHLDEIDRRKAMTPLFRQTLAEWETESGQVERMRERYTEAVKHFAAAERVYGALIAEGFQVDNCRFAVARQQMSFAYAAGKTGDFDKALQAQHTGVEQLTDLLKSRTDDRGIQQSLERARTNMVEIGKEALQRDLPAPEKNTVANLVKHHQDRLARWQAWYKQYPAVEGFRRQTVEEAIWIAAQYGVLLDPAKKIEGDDRKQLLDKIAEALKLARDNGLTDAALLEANPGLAHFRKLPEYQQFLQTLK